MKSYDPKLREAMAEVQEILKRHDIGGFVTLQSRSHAEFKMFIDTPSWSKVRWIKEGEALHLKIHMKTSPKESEETVSMLYSIRDICGLIFTQIDKLAEQVQQSVKVEHVKFGGGIKNEDRE